MSKETGGPAFPTHTLEPNPDGGQPRIIWQEGMTLRDYFAAKAMAALYQSHYDYEFTGKPREHEFVALMDELAVDAYGIADSMLKAREL